MFLPLSVKASVVPSPCQSQPVHHPLSSIFLHFRETLHLSFSSLFFLAIICHFRCSSLQSKPLILLFLVFFLVFCLFCASARNPTRNPTQNPIGTFALCICSRIFPLKLFLKFRGNIFYRSDPKSFFFYRSNPRNKM